MRSATEPLSTAPGDRRVWTDQRKVEQRWPLPVLAAQPLIDLNLTRIFATG
jgi:hypothetical protein